MYMRLMGQRACARGCLVGWCDTLTKTVGAIHSRGGAPLTRAPCTAAAAAASLCDRSGRPPFAAAAAAAWCAKLRRRIPSSRSWWGRAEEGAICSKPSRPRRPGRCFSMSNSNCKRASNKPRNEASKTKERPACCNKGSGGEGERQAYLLPCLRVLRVVVLPQPSKRKHTSPQSSVSCLSTQPGPNTISICPKPVLANLAVAVAFGFAWLQSFLLPVEHSEWEWMWEGIDGRAH